VPPILPWIHTDPSPWRLNLTGVLRALLLHLMGSPEGGAALVLGGSGFLGTHVVAALGSRAVSASRAEGPRSAPQFVKLDARAAGSLGQVLSSVKPAVIVDCAAFSSVAEAETHPDVARRLNVDVPRELGRWCAAGGVRLVHVSTDLVFGGKPSPPAGFGEEDPPAPVSEYGRSKAAGESALLEVFPGALVVRLPLLYGNSFGRGRGASDSLLASLGNGLRPMLFTDEWRTPLEVANAAGALVELLERDVRGILHVAGPDRVSRYDLAMTVIDASRLSRGRLREQVRPGTRAEGKQSARPADVSLDSSRARAILSTPLLGVRAGLDAAFRSTEKAFDAG
jgi:dTDP-4-dehydrorhamnose reductase